MFTLGLAIPAFVLLPAGYAAMCIWMSRRPTWWFTYLAYFFIFGSVGGWCLTFSVASVGGPVAALSAGMMLLFLLVIAASACLVSSLILQFRRDKSKIERFAMFTGYAFLAVNAAFVTKFWM